ARPVPLHAQQRARDQQRVAVRPGDQDHDRGDGRGPRDVRDGLPLPVRARRGAVDGRPRHHRRAEEEVLPDQRRALVQALSDAAGELRAAIASYWKPHAIACAARLGIADVMDGTIAVTELARTLDLHPEALARFLRALAAI